MRRFEQRASETLVIGELLDRTVDAARDRRAGHRARRRHRAGAHPRLVGHPALRAQGRRRPPPPRRDARRRLGRRHRPVARRPPTRAPRACSPRRQACGRPTSPTCCTTCRPSAASRSPRPRRRAARRRPRGAARGRPGRDPRRRSRPSAPPTSSRRWTPTTPPTCSPSCRPSRPEELLALMEPEEAEDLRRLLAYDDYTAGGMMTTEPVILPPDATVAEALARIRDPDLSPALAAQVYVVRAPLETPTGRYLGACHFQRLLREPPATLVSALLDTNLEPVGPDTPADAGHALLRHLQPRRAARRRRERPPARRGHRRRRHRPHAARGLARRRRRRRGD